MLRFIIFCFLTISLFRSGTASAELSAFEQTLENNQTVETRESVEVRNGVTYRKVESNHGTYYFKLLGRNQELSELDCATAFDSSSPHLVTVGVKIFRRARLFMRGLQETCKNQNGHQRYGIDWLSPSIGIQLPDSKRSKLKDVEVHVNPFQIGGGFSGTFP